MSVTLSVLIPCFNEGETIRVMVGKVSAQKPLVQQIIVANDGSTDKTRQTLDKLAADWKEPGVSLLVTHLEQNQGKGAAVRAALALASEPYIVIQDADLELDPANYPALIQPIRDGTADVVFGNRFHKDFKIRIRIPSIIANWAVTITSNILYGLTLRDQACGYKVLPTALAKQLNLSTDGFEICSEMTAKLGLRKARIASVPVHYVPRDEAHGKKIRWVDGFVAIYTLMYYRLTSFSRRTS